MNKAWWGTRAWCLGMAGAILLVLGGLCGIALSCTLPLGESTVWGQRAVYLSAAGMAGMLALITGGMLRDAWREEM